MNRTDLTPTEVPTPEAGAPAPSDAVRHWRVPALDVAEKDGDLRVLVDLPGVAPEGLALEVVDGRLTLEARRLDAADHGYRRTLALPRTVDTDRIDAALAHGVLTLTLPLREARRPRVIAVRGA